MANKKQKKILKIENVDSIIENVIKYKRIKVNNLGFFLIRKYAGKINKINKFASSDARIPAHFRLVFRPLKSVKKAINK